MTVAGLAAVATAGRPTAAITAIATSANARCQMVLWAEDDLKVWVLMGLKIVRTAPNRYVSGPERARLGNGKLTITRLGWGGLGSAWFEVSRWISKVCAGACPSIKWVSGFSG